MYAIIHPRFYFHTVNRTPPPVEEFLPPTDDGMQFMFLSITCHLTIYVFTCPLLFIVFWNGNESNWIWFLVTFYVEPSSSLSQSTGTDPESPRPEPSKRSTKFKFVTTRTQKQESPRRSSVPALNPALSLSPSHLFSQPNLNRSRSPDYPYSRQSSLSDDSSGPASSRSMETARAPNPSYPPPQLPQIR